MHHFPNDYVTELLTLLIICVSGAFVFNRIIIAYKQNNDWLALAFAKIGDALITTDKNGHVTRLNAVAEKLTGWKAAEAKGKHFQEIVKLLDHDTRTEKESPITEVLARSAVAKLSGHTIMRSRDSSEVPVECVAAPTVTKKKQLSGCVLIFRDISESFNVMQKLAESEDRLRAVTNQARIGLVMINRDRRYIYANNFYMQMIGFSDLYVLGKKVEEVLPMIYERIRPYLDRAFNGERLSYEVTGNYRKEQGLNRTYSVTYEPQLRQSLVMNVVIVIIDITDIKNARA